MKITCDFLPKEYKSIRVNPKLYLVAAVVWGLTGVLCAWTWMSYQKSLKTSQEQVTSQETTISLLESQINSLNYDQTKIRGLIQKYRFIQQAMGSTDFPFLEFMQALEESIPTAEDSERRRVAVKTLKNTGGSAWTLLGVAQHWDDVLAFEDKLNQSTFERPELGPDGTVVKGPKKKNFRSVRVFRVDTTDKGVEFELSFEFNG
jgi:Tfp pilus assembly protein PilN